MDWEAILEHLKKMKEGHDGVMAELAKSTLDDVRQIEFFTQMTLMTPRVEWLVRKVELYKEGKL